VNTFDSDILNIITPYRVDSGKVRMGNNCDGGYVISSIAIEKSNCLFSYGIGGDYTFDKHYCNQYNKPVYMFDHNPVVGQYIVLYPKMHFKAEGLGRGKNYKTVLKHVQEYNPPTPILLKIDIERSEYDYFERCNIEKLQELVCGMIIEFHDLGKENYRRRFVSILKKINPYFLLNHVHGNNFGGTFTLTTEHKQIEYFPRVVELSFINKNIVSKYEKDSERYPISGLDFPNKTNLEDINLNFIN
jgi:hypothetical protein